MKRIIALLLALIICLGLVACGAKEAPAEEKKEETSAPAEEKKEETKEEAPKEEAKTEEPEGIVVDKDGDGRIKTAMLTFALSTEQWQLMSSGVEKIGPDYGFDVTVIDCDGNATKQVEQIESCIEAGYECLMVSPCDSAAVINVLETAHSKGIAVATLDGGVTPAHAYLGVDEHANAYVCGKATAEWVNENWPDKEEVNFALLTWEYDASCVKRGQGLLDGFTENYKGKTNVICEISPVDAAEAVTMLESAFQAYKIDVCLAIAADQAYGFCLSAENAGYAHEDAVAGGMDITPASLDALINEQYMRFIGSWGNPATTKAQSMVNTAIKAVEQIEAGKTFEDMVMVEYTFGMVDASNAVATKTEFGW